MNRRTGHILAFVLAALMLVPSTAFSWEPNMNTSAVYSWVANDFNGQEQSLTYPYLTNQVMHDVAHLIVMPDGTAYTNVTWEENGQNFTEIQNGVITNVGEHSHGWGYGGGNVVAANSTYVYFAENVNNEGGNLYEFKPELYPPTGYGWDGVQRRLRSNIRIGANFEGGNGKWGAPEDQKQSFLTVVEYPEEAPLSITGMAADDEKLFVAVAGENRIYVYNAETMALIETWENIPTTGNIALDKEGNLWVIARDEGAILSYTQSGELRTQKVVYSEGVVPQALCFDKNNRLLFSDLGPNEQILIYDNISTTPAQTGTFGEKGGIYSGTPGKVADRKLNQVVGLGVDDNNQLVVANGGRFYINGSNGDAYFEGYDLNTGEKLWDLHGLFFVDQITIDPLEEEFVYSGNKKFKMDYTKSPGEEWSYEAWTVDPNKYPDDPRIRSKDYCGSDVIYLEGNKYLVLEQRDSYGLAIYRFEEGSEIAIPCAYFAEASALQPPNNPSNAFFVAWFDENGNGQFEAEEYEGYSSYPLSHGRKFEVDENGDIWRALDCGSVVKFPFVGVNEKGVPIWGDNSKIVVESLAEIVPNHYMKRAIYDSENDTMYFGLSDNTKPFLWRVSGEKIVVYKNWSKPESRRMLYHIDMPEGEYYEYIKCNNHPIGMSLAGDYLFVGYAGYPFVYIFNKTTGELVDIVDMPMEVTSVNWALVDVVNSYQAHKLQNGEYVIFIEDDHKSKSWMLRWTDEGLKSFNENGAPAVLVDTRQLVFIAPQPQPTLENGKVIASIPHTFRALGITVREYTEDEAAHLELSHNETAVVLTEGATTVTGSVSGSISIAPSKVNGIWVGPVGELAALFGLSVTEEPSKKLVNINTPEGYVTLHGEIEDVTYLPLPFTISAFDDSRLSYGVASVTVTKNLEPYEGERVTLVVAVYDTAGKVTDVQIREVSDTLAVGSSQTLEVTRLIIPEGGTAKAFLWNNLLSLVPYR